MLTITKCFCTYCGLGEYFTANATCNTPLCHLFPMYFSYFSYPFQKIDSTNYFWNCCNKNYWDQTALYPFINSGYISINYYSPHHFNFNCSYTFQLTQHFNFKISSGFVSMLENHTVCYWRHTLVFLLSIPIPAEVKFQVILKIKVFKMYYVVILLR